MADKKINFIVGLVVLVSLIILIVGVYFLQNKKPLEKKDEYYALFSHVSTLQLNDPVNINGVTVGRVRAKELWKNKVRVTIFIKRFFKKTDGTLEKIQIPKNSEIVIQNIGLMGERQIEIYLGDSQEYYVPKEIIKNARTDGGIAEAMGSANRVFDQAELLIDDIKSMFDSTFGQAEFKELFEGVLNNTHEITQKMNTMLVELDPKIKSSLNNMEKASVELEQLLNSEEGPIHQILKNGNLITEKVYGLTGKVESLADEVSGILTKINSNDGTLGALIHDTTFYGDIQSTVQNLDSLLLLIRKQGLDVNVDIF